MIDDIDRAILAILQENGRVTNAEIARQVGMAPSAILERVRKLEERGVIDGYTVRLNPDKLCCGLLAYILVRTDERVWQCQSGNALKGIAEVQEIHHVAGEDCFLVKVRTKNTEALATLLRDEFGAIESIRSTRTTIVLNSVKETNVLPLPVTSEVKSDE